jgi:phage tail protein domain
MAKTSQALPLSVQLVSMRSPEAQITQAGAGCSLLICPGEPSEILVKLTNSSNHTKHIELRLEGDFPRHWCRIGMEGNLLLPHSQMEAVLYFQIEPDFFENKEVLPQNIDHTAQLLVYAEQDLVESAPIYLYVRPQSQYLQYLPDIYREVDFVGRLLKIFEETLEPVAQKLDLLWAYLDPLTAPPTLLPFLAHWVGWELSPALTIDRQRFLIKQALQLYRWRGTKLGCGLSAFIYRSAATPEHIQITEVAGRGFVMNEARMGQDTIVGGGLPYHFLVHLRNNLGLSLNRTLIERIIEQEKPAFCTYELVIEEPASHE